VTVFIAESHEQWTLLIFLLLHFFKILSLYFRQSGSAGDDYLNDIKLSLEKSKTSWFVLAFDKLCGTSKKAHVEAMHSNEGIAETKKKKIGRENSAFFCHHKVSTVSSM
jgi:hypothetical protein